MLGNDFEFGTACTSGLSSCFLRDSSVPIELYCPPAEKAREEVLFVTAMLETLQAELYGRDFFGGSLYDDRPIGGHVHISGVWVDEISRKQRNSLDLLLAVPVAAVADHEAFVIRVVESNYGKLTQSRGYHRDREHKNYGFEYRALPSPPSKAAAKAIFAMAQLWQRDITKNKSALCEELGHVAWWKKIYYNHQVNALRKLALRVFKIAWPHMSYEEKQDVAFLKMLILQKKTWAEDRPCAVGWKLKKKLVVFSQDDDYLAEIASKLEPFVSQPLRLYGRYDRPSGENPNIVQADERRNFGLSLNFRRRLVNDDKDAWEELTNVVNQ